MAEYRTVKMSFWTDPYIEELPTEGKLLYMYLFTCPHTNNLGVVETTMKRISYETGIDQKKVNTLLAEMERNGKIVRDGSYIWLTHFVKHQCSTSPKIKQSIKNILFELSSAKIRNIVCIRYASLLEFTDEEKAQLDTLSKNDSEQKIPYAYPISEPQIPSPESGMYLKGEREDGSIEGEDSARARDNARPQRKKYGQFESVLLTDNEHAKLISQFGEEKAANLIERLDGYIASKGVKYKSHYATMLNWARSDQESAQKQGTNNEYQIDLSFAHEERHV